MSCSWCVREVPGRRMEPSSWQVHFRNLISTPARLALRPRFGDHRVGPVPPVFYFLLVEGRASSPVQTERSSAVAGGARGEYGSYQCLALTMPQLFPRKIADSKYSTRR